MLVTDSMRSSTIVQFRPKSKSDQVIFTNSDGSAKVLEDMVTECRGRCALEWKRVSGRYAQVTIRRYLYTPERDIIKPTVRFFIVLHTLYVAVHFGSHSVRLFHCRMQC